MRFGCVGLSPLVPHAVLIQAVRIIIRGTVARSGPRQSEDTIGACEIRVTENTKIGSKKNS